MVAAARGRPPESLPERGATSIDWPPRCSAAGGRLAERKVFTRRDVIVAVGPSLFGHDPGVVGPGGSRVLRHPEVVPLVGVAGAREQAYAPACVIAVEAAIADVMEAAAVPDVGGRREPARVEAGHLGQGSATRAAV